MLLYYFYMVKQNNIVMQKIIELIEQLRFAELKKIDKLSSAKQAQIDQGSVSDKNASS